MSITTARARLGFAAVIAAATLAGSASTALAQEEAERPLEPGPGRMANLGLQVGARLGYAVGIGSVYEGLAVYDASYGTLPLVVDVGWRALPELYVGAYGQLAPVFLRTNPQSCPENFQCSARDWRFGLQADIHFLPRTSLDPYIGVGAGYEVLNTTVNGTAPIPLPTGTVPGNVDSSVTERGWEFGNLTVGFDYRLSRGVGFGPFFTATLARFNVRESDRTVTVAGNNIPSAPAPVAHSDHAQFIIGARGTFNP